MIERQIDRLIPIPLGLVVKKALKSCSAFSGSMPTRARRTEAGGGPVLPSPKKDNREGSLQ